MKLERYVFTVDGVEVGIHGGKFWLTMEGYLFSEREIAEALTTMFNPKRWQTREYYDFFAKNKLIVVKKEFVVESGE